jgi:acylphosphatase
MIGALTTHSTFAYGWQITTTNRYIDFNDGTTKTVALDIGSYTSIQLAQEIERQLDGASSLDFTVTFDRVAKKFTIAANSTFSLLFLTGVNNSQSPYELLGYTQTDKTGSSSYLAESTSGIYYSTQFILQSYKDTSTNRRAIDGVVNKSANGTVEVIKFGNERMMECEFNFITNLQQEQGSIIRENLTGLEEFTQMMEWLTEKYPVEFMKDESVLTTYEAFILESTESDQNGLNYDLIELYDRGLSYYFRSGILKFKRIEV